MPDILFLLATLSCFATALGYVTACDHLKVKPKP